MHLCGSTILDLHEQSQLFVIFDCNYAEYGVFCLVLVTCCGNTVATVLLKERNMAQRIGTSGIFLGYKAYVCVYTYIGNALTQVVEWDNSIFPVNLIVEKLVISPIHVSTDVQSSIRKILICSK